MRGEKVYKLRKGQIYSDLPNILQKDVVWLRLAKQTKTAVCFEKVKGNVHKMETVIRLPTQVSSQLSL